MSETLAGGGNAALLWDGLFDASFTVRSQSWQTQSPTCGGTPIPFTSRLFKAYNHRVNSSSFLGVDATTGLGYFNIVPKIGTMLQDYSNAGGIPPNCYKTNILAVSNPDATMTGPGGCTLAAP